MRRESGTRDRVLLFARRTWHRGMLYLTRCLASVLLG
jgi:hypothetical protein